MSMRMDCLSKMPKDYVFIPFLSPRGKPWYVYNALFNEGKCVNKQCRVWICQRGILRINNISQYLSRKHQMQICTYIVTEKQKYGVLRQPELFYLMKTSYNNNSDCTNVYVCIFHTTSKIWVTFSAVLLQRISFTWRLSDNISVPLKCIQITA